MRLNWLWQKRRSPFWSSRLRRGNRSPIRDSALPSLSLPRRAEACVRTHKQTCLLPDSRRRQQETNSCGRSGSACGQCERRSKKVLVKWQRPF